MEDAQTAAVEDAGEPKRGRAGAREEKRWSRRGRIVALAVGLALIAVVCAFGYYQFDHRASAAIEMVKSIPMHGTDVTIGEGALDFIKSGGVEVVSEGFRPTWGAEEVGDGEWVVSYVFEVGRESSWARWKVDARTGEVTPTNDLAREMQLGGDRP